MKVFNANFDKIAPPTKRTFSVVSVGQVRYDLIGDATTIRPRGRVDYSLYFVENGVVYFDKEAKVQKGQMFLYNAYTPQYYAIYAQEKTSYYYLHFNGSDLGGVLSSLGVTEKTVFNVRGEAVKAIFTKLLSVYGLSDPLSQLKSERYVNELISVIVEGFNKAEKKGGGVFIVTDYMEHNYGAPYSAEKFAKMLNVSVSGFNHLFKSETGVPPKEYYIKIRLKAAEQLLKYTDKPISKVAKSVGYDNEVYFYRLFVKNYGVSPSDFRRNNS